MKKPKINVTYADCTVHVVGTNLKCPLCGTLVKDDEFHSCTRPESKSYVGHNIPITPPGPRGKA